MKKKYIDHYMAIAELTAKLSYANKLKVGSILVKKDQILASGYNGTPSGFTNECENKIYDNGVDQNNTYTFADADGRRYKLVTKDEVLHSEMNTLMKVAKSTVSSENSIMFCTHAPCIQCAKAIYQAGVIQLFYKNEYRSNSGILFLNDCGVNVIKYIND